MKQARLGRGVWAKLIAMATACAALSLALGCGDSGVSPIGGSGGAGPSSGGGVPGGGAPGEGGADPGNGGATATGGGGAAPIGGGGAAEGPTFGYPVYTQAEIDAWSTASPEYTRLANSWAGNVDRPHASYGAEISSVERDVLKDESGYMKVQAVLWAADGNAERRDKVVAMLDELREVTSWEFDAGEQYRLVAGWSCTNLAQAAAIIDYNDPQFATFLVDECFAILDWSNGGNWHASFADSRLAIAAYIGDPALWADAKAYFHMRIRQSIYHSSYDGDAVQPLLNENDMPQVSLTKSHWGGTWSVTQINDDFTPINPAQFPDGTNAERTRDLNHVSMGLGGWMHGARTVLAQGEALEPHAYDRLLAAYAHHGDRVLTYLTTGTIPAPTTAYGGGGGGFSQGWFGARALFEASTPADVLTLCDHEDVTGYPAAGANHLVAEAFADEL